MEGDFHTECWNEGIIDNLRQQLKDLSSDDDDYGRLCDKLQMHEQMTDHTRNVLIAISKAAREDKAYLMPVIGPMFVVSCVSIVQSACIVYVYTHCVSCCTPTELSRSTPVQGSVKDGNVLHDTNSRRL
jgi:hypothetical protein